MRVLSAIVFVSAFMMPLAGCSVGGGNDTGITEGTTHQYVIDKIPSTKELNLVNLQDATDSYAGRILAKNGEAVYYIGLTDEYSNYHRFFVTASGEIHTADNVQNLQRVYP